MPCARRLAVFSIAFLVWACPAISFAWDPVDSAAPGDSLNGPDFGIGAVIDHLEWALLRDGRVVVPSIRDGLVVGISNPVVKADAMRGAIMLARDSIGNATLFTIESFRRLPGGIAMYTVWRQVDLYTDAISSEPVCTDESGKASEGTFLPGHWDEKTGNYFDDGFTIGCSGGALDKCNQAGYRPFDPDLLDSFQACVRMIRADYCGDGISHTREGTPISFGDSLGIHYMSSDPEWQFEAVWTRKGASCIASVPTKGDSGASLPIKRWTNLWKAGKCLIPSCSSDLAAPSGMATLSSACRPNSSQPTKCAPWYFIPSP